ncbi:hypothetical protein ACFL0W_00120 [Nanoarchaeota archaeon]
MNKEQELHHIVQFIPKLHKLVIELTKDLMPNQEIDDNLRAKFSHLQEILDELLKEEAPLGSFLREKNPVLWSELEIQVLHDFKKFLSEISGKDVLSPQDVASLGHLRNKLKDFIEKDEAVLHDMDEEALAVINNEPLLEELLSRIPKLHKKLDNLIQLLKPHRVINEDLLVKVHEEGKEKITEVRELVDLVLNDEKKLISIIKNNSPKSEIDKHLSLLRNQHHGVLKEIENKEFLDSTDITNLLAIKRMLGKLVSVDKPAIAELEQEVEELEYKYNNLRIALIVFVIVMFFLIFWRAGVFSLLTGFL